MFIGWIGDPRPRHVHVFDKEDRLITRVNLETMQPTDISQIEGEILVLIRQLQTEGRTWSLPTACASSNRTPPSARPTRFHPRPSSTIWKSKTGARPVSMFIRTTARWPRCPGPSSANSRRRNNLLRPCAANRQRRRRRAEGENRRRRILRRAHRTKR